MLRRVTNYIVVHGTYTPPQMDVTPQDVHLWHRQRGFRGNGYHLHIPRDGLVQLTQRGWDEVGAGVIGHNHHSFHVVMVGGMPADAERARRGEWECNYTPRQFGSLRAVLASLRMKYPQARVVGHKDLDTRQCPGFDVQLWLSLL
jgi:N-acetylmuramoyl-L-alanine amidase